MRKLLVVVATVLSACGESGPFTPRETCVIGASVVYLQSGKCEDVEFGIQEAQNWLTGWDFMSKRELARSLSDTSIWVFETNITSYDHNTGVYIWGDDQIWLGNWLASTFHEMYHVYERKELGFTKQQSCQHISWDSPKLENADQWYHDTMAEHMMARLSGE